MAATRVIDRKKYRLEYAGIDGDIARSVAKNWKKSKWDVKTFIEDGRFGKFYQVWVHKGKTAQMQSASYPYRVLGKK